MVKVRSFNKKPGAVLARRSGPFASPRSGSNSNCEVTYGELEAGAEDGAEAVADESVAAAGAAAESGAEAAVAAESVAAGVAVVSVLAQAASASAATRALRTSFVFIELYPEKEKGKR
jgi:hypothetical protein